MGSVAQAPVERLSRSHTVLRDPDALPGYFLPQTDFDVALEQCVLIEIEHALFSSDARHCPPPMTWKSV